MFNFVQEVLISAIRLKEEKKEERWDRTEKEGSGREEIKGIHIGNKEAKLSSFTEI